VVGGVSKVQICAPLRRQTCYGKRGAELSTHNKNAAGRSAENAASSYASFCLWCNRQGLVDSRKVHKEK